MSHGTPGKAAHATWYQNFSGAQQSSRDLNTGLVFPIAQHHALWKTWLTMLQATSAAQTLLFICRTTTSRGPRHGIALLCPGTAQSCWLRAGAPGELTWHWQPPSASHGCLPALCHPISLFWSITSLQRIFRFETRVPGSSSSVAVGEASQGQVTWRNSSPSRLSPARFASQARQTRETNIFSYGSCMCSQSFISPWGRSCHSLPELLFPVHQEFSSNLHSGRQHGLPSLLLSKTSWKDPAGISPVHGYLLGSCQWGHSQNLSGISFTMNGIQSKIGSQSNLLANTRRGSWLAASPRRGRHGLVTCSSDSTLQEAPSRRKFSLQRKKETSSSTEERARQWVWTSVAYQDVYLLLFFPPDLPWDLRQPALIFPEVLSGLCMQRKHQGSAPWQTGCMPTWFPVIMPGTAWHHEDMEIIPDQSKATGRGIFCLKHFQNKNI